MSDEFSEEAGGFSGRSVVPSSTCSVRQNMTSPAGAPPALTGRLGNRPGASRHTHARANAGVTAGGGSSDERSPDW